MMATGTETRRGWLQKKKTFCLITGASRGLGKTLAVYISPFLAKDSVLVLVARDTAALQNVKDTVEKKVQGAKVIVRSQDLGDPQVSHAEGFKELLSSSLRESNADKTSFDQAIIIHNAGTLGRCALAEDYGILQEWTDYLTANVASTISLNCAFLKTFQAPEVGQLLVINISSLAAVKPIPSCGMYNTGKAAREAYFKTLAVENEDVTVLNYSPGPLDTNMFHYVCDNVIHPKGKQMFTDTVANGMVLTCETTTKKLLDILEKESFQSGDSVDYYD